MARVFVFDLDDTLMDNVHDYSQPLLDACGLIIKTLGAKAPHVAVLINLIQAIDKRRVNEINPKTGKPFMYSMARFPGSLVEAYYEVCRKTDAEYQSKVVDELHQIGLEAFNPANYAQRIKDSTRWLMPMLEKAGEETALLTKGDPEVQRCKIEALGKYDIRFSKVEIVEFAKTTEIFAEIKAGFGKNCEDWTFYSVGNDYDKDIVPALAAGYTGIYIPVETWESLGKMEEIRNRVDWEKCVILASLDGIVPCMERGFL